MFSDYIKATILGVLEGLTEFIPVSSTGHLILAGDALSFSIGNTGTFNIAIQLGAILAVVVLYKERFRFLIQPKNWLSPLGKKIMLAIAPALALGFLLHDFIKTVLFSSQTVLYALLVGGIVMIIVDILLPKAHSDTQNIDTISYKQALGIGIAQCFALWPGMSRSGSTIVGGLIAKLDYKTAAEFSFIISVPVMVAAVSYDLLKTAASLTTHDFLLIGVGFAVSFVVALLAIVTFLKLLVRFKLAPFGVYRIILALIIWFL